MRKEEDMNKLENLRDTLCAELDKVARKEDINTSDLDIIDKLTHSIKNLDKVMIGNEMIDEYGYSFYSGARRGGRRGRDGDGDGRYNESRSYDRSYDRSYNRSREGYSGHYDDKSIERFKDMMNTALHEL